MHNAGLPAVCCRSLEPGTDARFLMITRRCITDTRTILAISPKAAGRCRGFAAGRFFCCPWFTEHRVLSCSYVLTVTI